MKKDPILNLISFMENFDSQVYHHRAPLPPHALSSSNPLNTGGCGATLHYPPPHFSNQMAAATAYQDSSYLSQHSSQNVYLNQRNCYSSVGNNLPCSYPNSFLNKNSATTYHQYGDSNYPSASVIQRNSLPCREASAHPSTSRFLPHSMTPSSSPSLTNQVSIPGKSYPPPYQNQVSNTRMLNDYLMKPCNYPKPLHQPQQQIQDTKAALYPAPPPTSLQNNMGAYYPKYTGHFTSLHGTNYTSNHHSHALHESKPSPLNLPTSAADNSQISILNCYSISQQQKQHCLTPTSHYMPDSVNITPLSSSSMISPSPNVLMQTTSVIKKNPILERLLDNGSSAGLSNNDASPMNCLLSPHSSTHHEAYDELDRKPDISQLQLSLQPSVSHSTNYDINNHMQAFNHSLSHVSQSEMGLMPSPSLSADQAHGRARKTLRPLSYQLSNDQSYSLPPQVESHSTSSSDLPPPPLLRIKQEPGLEDQSANSCQVFNPPTEITSETLKDILFAKPPSCQPLPPPSLIKRNARKSFAKPIDFSESTETFGPLSGDTPSQIENAAPSNVDDKGPEDLLKLINETCDQVITSNIDNLPHVLQSSEKPKTTARKSLLGQKSFSPDNSDTNAAPLPSAENISQSVSLSLPLKNEIEDTDVPDMDSSIISIDFTMSLTEPPASSQVPDAPLQDSFPGTNFQDTTVKDLNVTGPDFAEMEKPCDDITINALKRKINALIDMAHEPQKKKRAGHNRVETKENQFFHCPNSECSFCTTSSIDFASHLSNDEMGLIFNNVESKNESQTLSLNENHAIKQSTYQCILCSKFRTRSLAILTYHVYKEIDYKPYRCQVCDQTFVSSNYFIRHFRAVHNDQKPAHRLILDMKKKLAGEVILNYIQATQFVDLSDRAPTSSMDEYKFHCPDCGVKLRDPIELQRHLFRDQKYFPYKCLHCHKSFIEYETSHFRNKHPNQPIKYYKTTIEDIEKKVIQIVEEQKLIRDSKREAKIFLKKYDVFKCVFAENCTFETTMVDILETHIICHLSSSKYKCAYCFVTTNYIDKLKSHYHKYHKGSPVMILNTKEVLAMQQQVSEKNKKDHMLNGMMTPLETERETIVITPSDISASSMHSISSQSSPFGSSCPSPCNTSQQQSIEAPNTFSSNTLPNNVIPPLNALSNMSIPHQIESQGNSSLPTASLDSIVFRLKQEMQGQESKNLKASPDKSQSTNLIPSSDPSPAITSAEIDPSLTILPSTSANYPQSPVVTSTYSAGAYKVTHFNKPQPPMTININDYFRHKSPKKTQKRSPIGSKKKTKPIKAKTSVKPTPVLQVTPPLPPLPKPKLAKDLINEMSLSTLEKISEGYFKPTKKEVPNVRTILMQKQFLKALEASEKLDNTSKDVSNEDNLLQPSSTNFPPSTDNSSSHLQLKVVAETDNLNLTKNEGSTAKEEGLDKYSSSNEDAPGSKSLTSRKSLIPASSTAGGIVSPSELMLPGQRKMTARKSLLPKNVQSPSLHASSLLTPTKRTARKSMKPSIWTSLPKRQKARKSFNTATAHSPLEEFSYYRQPRSPLDTSNIYYLLPFNICENMVPVKVKYNQLPFDIHPKVKLTSVLSPYFVDEVKS